MAAFWCEGGAQSEKQEAEEPHVARYIEMGLVAFSMKIWDIADDRVVL